MKRLKVSLIAAISVFISMLFTNMVYAVNTMKLNIKENRPYTNSKYTVTIGGQGTHKEATVFKVLRKDGTTWATSDKFALYCLRAGLGFGSLDLTGIQNLPDVEYTEYGDMKQEANKIIDYYKNVIGYTNIDADNSYNAMLWIIDNMHLPENQDMDKETLLKKAGLENSSLTDDEIEVIQQMALWYFSNYDLNGRDYSLSLPDTTHLSSILKKDGTSYSNISELDQIDDLYRYFVDNAKVNAASYGTGNIRNINLTTPRVEIDKTKPLTITQDSNGFYVIGPINIRKTNLVHDFDVSVKIMDAQGNVIPETAEGNIPILINSQGTQLKLEDLIGNGEVYVKISNIFDAGFDLSGITVETTTTYFETKASLWTAEEEDQPIVKVEKEKKVEKDRITTNRVTGELKLKINKTDKAGTPVTGAGFTVIDETEGRVQIILKDLGNGAFETVTINIDKDGQEFIFNIEETTIPSGYIGLSAPFRIKVTTKLSADKSKYIIDDVKLVDGTGATVTVPGIRLNFNVNTGEITITIENEKINKIQGNLKLKINKTDEAGTPLLGAGFTIIDETEGRRPIVLRNIGNGVFETEIVNIQKEGQTFIFNIEETTVPSGYTGLSAPFRIKVTTKLSADKSKYIIDDVKLVDNTGATVSILGINLNFNVNTGEITITIENEKINKIPGNLKLKINKTDKAGTPVTGAGFTVIDETEGRVQIILKDLGNGAFETVTINIDKDGQEFIFNIEETTIPSGYIGLSAPFRIKVTTKLSADKSKYIIDEVKLVDKSGATVTIPGIKLSFVADTGEITITVENDKNKEFDLALRKYITKINGKELTGKDDRTPKVDTSKLNTFDVAAGKKITTATYTHSKTPLVVKKGDIVTYKIRIYNEGEIDGYATEIADYIPEGLGYLMNHKTNTENLWHPVVDGTNQTMKLVGTNGFYTDEASVANLELDDFFGVTALKDVEILKGKAKIYSTALENEKIKAYDKELTSTDIDSTDTWQQSTNGTDGLYYREVEVTCIVLAENSYDGILRNIAEIQKDKAIDKEGNIIKIGDRDSTPNNVNIDNYKPPVDNSSYQEDDDDYEPLILRHFDLALRKFITGVNDEEVTTRIPEPKLDEDGNIKYEHDKTPVYVANSDLVTYTIRVYNEGTVLGYAMEVADDIPDGLIFLPEHQINKEFGWEMYDISGQKTDKVDEAVAIKTKKLENSLLQPYDSTKAISTTEPYNPDYAEVKVVFKVNELGITSPDRIITNKAQITEDKAVDEDGNEIDIDDDDSVPNVWNDGEDDQDTEKVYVKYFDLALLKWVTKTIVTVDGQTTESETGFTPYDKPEPVAKVVIDKNKINKTTVKFVYKIMIMNQGEIAGAATEITDYIPAGLQFVPEDNPLWEKTGDNTIATRALEGKILQPGETAEVEVIFKWINSSENLGTKTNIAEISEDYNDKGSPDIDSTPDNVKPDGYDEQQEDDDDKALVILEIKTGGNPTYVGLTLVVLTILATGIALIKKYVLV